MEILNIKKRLDFLGENEKLAVEEWSKETTQDKISKKIN